MFEFKKIKITNPSNKNQIKKYDLGNKVIALKGKMNTGKSTFISLFYLLMGSKSTEKEFVIHKNDEFNFKDECKVELIMEDGIGMFSHSLLIEDGKISYFINKRKSTLKSLKENFKRRIINKKNDMKIYNFAKNEEITIDQYNINIFFRSYKKIKGNIFNYSPNHTINDFITKILLKAKKEAIDLEIKKQIFYTKKEELIKKKRKTSLLDSERKELEKIIENFTKGNDLNKININNLIEKRTKYLYKIFLLRNALESFGNTEENISDYEKIFKILNKINFKNKKLEKKMKEYWNSKIKENINILISKKSIESEITKLIKQNEKNDKELEIYSSGEKEIEKINYAKMRKKYIEKIIQKDFNEDKNILNNLEKELKKINENIKEINENIKEIENDNPFIEESNKLLGEFDQSDSKYISINDKFELKRNKKSSTSMELMDKLIPFIIASKISFENLKKYNFYPNIISINSMIRDSRDKDIKIFKNIMDKFSKNLNKISSFGSLILIQDKYNEINGDGIEKIDFDKENPFNKILN